MRSWAGQPLRSAATSSRSGLNSMMAPITPISACSSRVIESVRMRRSDHDLMSSHRSSGKPEQVGGEPRRELGGEVVDHLEPPLRRLTASMSSSMRDWRNGLVLLDGPGREPPADEAALLEVLRVVEGDHVRLLHPDVGPVGARRREHVAAALDVEQVGVAGDRPEAVGVVAVDGCLAAGPGEEVVHPVEVDPPRRVEQVGGAGVGRGHGRTVPGTRRGQRASMSHDEAEAHDERERDVLRAPRHERGHHPGEEPGLPEVELPLGAEERGHDDGGEGGRWDLAQEALDARVGRRPGGARRRGTRPAWRRCRCRPARSPSRPGSRHEPRVRGEGRLVAGSAPIADGLGARAGRDAGQRSEEDAQVARARLVGEQGDEAADEGRDGGWSRS